MGVFYSRLSYSVGNEDWKTEAKALQIQPSDRILCVTASGDRPLNLLCTNCKEIVAVDANPFQNALFDLKKAALETLEYDEYIAFLGTSSHRERYNTFKLLEKKLLPLSAALWKDHPSKIRNGVLYEGAVEKLTKKGASIIQLFRGEKIERLFSCKTLNEQKTFVQEEWNTSLWKATFKIVLHPFFTRFFLRDPGLYRHVSPNIHVGNHIYNRMGDALSRFPAKESILISLVLQGKVFQEGYSPYLTQSGYETIKPRLHKASFVTTDLIEYLEKAPPESFDCFSLSDVASYISEQDFKRLVTAMTKAARPGARFCIRQFMTRYELPKEVSPILERNTALENELEREDRCFLYHFAVGTVKK